MGRHQLQDGYHVVRYLPGIPAAALGKSLQANCAASGDMACNSLNECSYVCFLLGEQLSTRQWLG